MDRLKTLVIGLDGASPALWFENENLVNLRRLMQAGCYGPLQGVMPPSHVLSWCCLATGRDPGALGIYGPRNRLDHSYSAPRPTDERMIAEWGTWVRTLHSFSELREALRRDDWRSLLLIAPGAAGLYGAAPRDFLKNFDEELDGVLESLDEETLVLVVSTHGAQACRGGFCVDQWLMREGLLTLRGEPSEATPIDQLGVDWSETRVWSEGGDVASLFFNVRGREPAGIIAPEELDTFRAGLKARLEAIADPRGKPLSTRVFEPGKTYSAVRGIAPDLLVEFGGMAWRAIDGAGRPSLYLDPEAAGESIAPTEEGAFVLAAPGLPGAGLIEGASLLDIAPTLLELNGREPLPDMRGRSLLGRLSADRPSTSSDPDDDERLIRERLSGLGYLG